MVQQQESVVTFVPIRRQAAARYLFYERIFDLIVATVSIVVLSPFLLIVAIAVLIEDGWPIFFVQRRVGRKRKAFRMLKFRSMYRNHDQTLHLQHTEQVLAGDTLLRIEEDPRVTRVGRIIRKWSFDELPNLVNVVKGDMSLVGPRPLVPYETYDIHGVHAIRFSVRPGMTGLAQISGRLDMTHEERLNLNVEYVRTRNVRKDIAIICKTIPSMIRNRG